MAELSSVDITKPHYRIGEVNLGEIGEWRLVELIREKLKLPRSDEVLVDIGDDAACVKLEGPSVLTTDSYLEDVHFSLRHYDFRDIGYRSLASSLSDVAAMGAEPRFVLISLQIPLETTVEDVERLYAGMIELAHRFDFRIVGGDTVRSRSVGIVCTVIGQADEPIERRGAKPGDAIFVTGELGSSAFGLYLMKAQIHTPESADFIEIHKRPFPRVEEGRLLSHSGVVSAMIDISDGLAMDIHHLAHESGVGALIHFETLPAHEGLQRLAAEYDQRAADFILYGGEDYELLFTIPSERRGTVPSRVTTKTGTKITEIGRIVEENRVELEKGGEVSLLPRRGYDHFQAENGLGSLF